MKRFLIPILAASAIASVAAPAFAQPASRYFPEGATTHRETTLILRRIDTGMAQGSINRNDGYRFRAEAKAIDRLANSYSVHGVTPAERNDLERRLTSLASRVQADVFDDGRGGNRGGERDRNGNRWDNDGSRWDRDGRHYDRNGNRL